MELMQHSVVSVDDTHYPDLVGVGKFSRRETKSVADLTLGE